MNLEKPVLPSATTAFATFAVVIGIATMYWTTGPGGLPATISDIWQFLWHEGSADPYSRCGIDLACRASNLHILLDDQLIRRHVILIIVAASIGGLCTFILSMVHVPIRETSQTILGQKLLYDADARQSFRRHLGRSGATDAQSLWVTPYVQLTKNAEAYNIGIVGGHGSGKTGLTLGLTEQVLERGDLTILHDAKGNLTAGLPTNDFILLSARDRRNWLWDIGRDIKDPNAAAEVSAKFIPAETTGETIWADSARSILSALIESMQRKHGLAWGWEELYRCIFLTPLQLRNQLEKIQSPVAKLIEFDSQGALSRTSQSILLTLWIATLQSIRPIAILAKSVPRSRRFSISEWISPGSKLPKTIVLQHAADYPILSTAVNGLLIEIVAGKILAPSSPNRSTPWLYLILDELPVLKRLNRLPELLNVGREKGVRCIAATQDWEQIEKYYGPEDSKTLEARLKIKIVCQLGICATRDRVAELFAGQRTVLNWDYVGENKPKVRRETRVPVIEHHQLSDELGVIKTRGQLNIRVAIFGLGTPGILNIPFTAWPERRPAHIPLQPRSAKSAKRTPKNQSRSQ